MAGEVVSQVGICVLDLLRAVSSREDDGQMMGDGVGM